MKIINKILYFIQGIICYIPAVVCGSVSLVLCGLLGAMCKSDVDGKPLITRLWTWKVYAWYLSKFFKEHDPNTFI